jgi:hypothetical protein
MTAGGSAVQKTKRGAGNHSCAALKTKRACAYKTVGIGISQQARIVTTIVIRKMAWIVFSVDMWVCSEAWKAVETAPPTSSLPHK